MNSEDEQRSELSTLLDQPGNLLPLATLGEARIMLHALNVAGISDSPAGEAARELETRIGRRLAAMFPSENIRLKTAYYDY